MFEKVIKQMVEENPSAYIDVASSLTDAFCDGLLQSLYYDNDNILMLVSNFFIIPRFLEQLPETRKIEVVPIFIRQLVENLPLVISMCTSIYDDAPEDEKILAGLSQLYSTKNNLLVFNYLMTTLLAHISLTIIDEIVERNEAHFNALDMVCLTRGKQICRCFFSSVDLASLKPLTDIFFELIHDVVEAVNGYKEVPLLLLQLQQGITSLLHYEQFQSWFAEYCEVTLQTRSVDFTWVSKVVNVSTFGGERPLIAIWLHNRSLIINIVESILLVHGSEYIYELLNASKKGDYEMKHLSKLTLGLQPFVHTEAKDVLFDFMKIICEKYSDQKTKSALIITWFCIKLFVENDCVGLDQHKNSLVKLMVKLNHFKLMAAFCLALHVRAEEVRSPGVKIFKKKCYTDLLAPKVISDTVVDIEANWFHLYSRNWSIFEPAFYVFMTIEPYFIEMYESYLVAHVHSNVEVFGALCQSIMVLRRHYSDLLMSKNKDNTHLEERLARCHGQFITAFFGTSDLNGALQTIQSTDTAAELKTLLIIISYAAPFQQVFGQFFFDKDIYNHDKYFELLTAQLSNKKMVGPLLDWVNNDESRANTVCEMLFFLLIVVTKAPGVIRGLHMFDLDKWRNFTFSLIASIAEDGMGLLREVLLAAIQSNKIPSRLPLMYRNKLCKSLGGQQGPAIDLGELDNLLSLFEEKVPSVSKKNKKKKNKPVETEAEVVIADRDLLDSIGTRATATSHFVDDDSAISDDLSNTEHELVVQATVHIDEVVVALPQVKTRFNLLCESLSKLTKSLDKQIKQMEAIVLPQAWLMIVGQVKSAVLMLKAQLKIPLGDVDVMQSQVYTALSSLDKILLEQKWNQELAIFCANAEREMVSYLTKSITDDASEDIGSLEHSINDVLLSLSGAYFKNIELHIKDDEIVLCLSLMSHFFKTNGYRMCIKGSYFAYPELAHDFDILLIPQNKMGPFNLEQNIKELKKRLNRDIYTGQINQKEDILFQKLSIQRADGQLMHIDLSILAHPLLAKEEGERTARAFLTLCAAHWYVDGHAVMLPKSAQGVCYKRPSLGLLKCFTTEDYLVLSGYLLKNIIKYGTQVRHDPLIKQFVDAYINPETRVLETQGSRRIMSNALQYLLDRFDSRTNIMIAYIVTNKLLQAIYPLDEPTWLLCTTYFSVHFNPANNLPFPITPSSPAFLVMCFLGGVIDQTEERRSQFIARLEQLVDVGPTQLKMALVILKRLPKQTNELFHHKLMYEGDKEKYDLSHQQASSFKIKVILQILECWHLKDMKKVKRKAIQVQDVFVPIFAATVSARKGPQSPVFFKEADERGQAAAADTDTIGVTLAPN